MGRKLESRLQHSIRKTLEQLYPNSWWAKIHGGPFQAAGIPDILGCVNGIMFALEVKLPGQLPTAPQQVTLVKLQLAGAKAGVVYSIDQATRFVEACLKNMCK